LLAPKPATKPNQAKVPKSNPIPATLSTVNGYPDRLKIYQVPASPYWWCRATFGERRITRSTKMLTLQELQTIEDAGKANGVNVLLRGPAWLSR
jgi:hypothetical protein